MRDASSKIEASGASLAVVGTGAPAFIAPFRETTRFAGAIYTDPTRKAFDAAGLIRGVTAVIDPRAGLAAVRALTGGFRQGRLQGDPWQQGGLLVVRPGGQVIYRFASRYSGDNPEPAEILAALGAA